MSYKGIIVLILIIFSNLNAFSQLNFEKGYYIDNNNKKNDGFIKNENWKNNPNDFLYKSNETDESQSISIEKVKEFGVGTNLIYVRADVKIDKSTNSYNSILSKNGELKFNDETLFLKVIVKGNANLYSFEDNNIIKYFYSTNTGEITQLIFKKYLSDENSIIENNGYKQQLFLDLKCQDVSQKDFDALKYNKKSLINVFKKYNSCKNTDEVFVIKDTKRSFKEAFNFSLKIGVANSVVTVDKVPYKPLELDFENEIGIRYGLEVEYILPYKKNKWALFFDPYYQKYGTEKNVVYTDLLSKRTNVYVDYQVLSLPIGVRYYSFINDDSKVFFNFLLSYNIDMKKDLTSDNDINLFDINSGHNFSLGLGYKYKDKYAIEIRNDFNRNITDYYAWDANYKSLSLTFGYTIF